MVQAKLVSALSPSLALIFRKVRIPKDWCNTDLKFLTHWEGVQQEGSRRHWSRRHPQEAPLWKRSDESQYLWGTPISRDCPDKHARQGPQWWYWWLCTRPWSDYVVGAQKSSLAHQRPPQALILDHATLKSPLTISASPQLESLSFSQLVYPMTNYTFLSLLPFSSVAH